MLRRMKHHHLAALRLSEPIREFVDDEVFAVVKIRFHGRALHDERLNKEVPNRKDDNECNRDHLDNLGNKQRRSTHTRAKTIAQTPASCLPNGEKAYAY